MTKELRPQTSRIVGYLWGGACLALLVIVGEDLHSCLTKPEAYPFGAENVSIYIGTSRRTWALTPC